MKQNRKVKILVALSGGVDSSVAAALLARAGYDVTAAYMVNYSDRQNSGLQTLDSGQQWKKSKVKSLKSAAVCWLPDYRDAARVAAKLNIPIIKLDFTKEYKEKVLNYMFREYRAGRTPNPDVLCNKFIKFGVWLTQTRKLGFDFLATGHYARLEIPNKIQKLKFKLLCAKDDNKDQTYFLHQLSQEQLRYVMFPIGGYTKPRVRGLAKKFGLPTAEKEESMGICFVGEVPMKEFLETKIKSKPGNIILSDGRGGISPSPSVGQHDGLAFYTIGQRHFGLSSLDSRLSSRNVTGQSSESRVQRPLYVLAKRHKTNELVVGYEDDPLLYAKEIIVNDVNWIGGQPSKFPLQCEVRLRHRQPLQRAVVSLWSLDSSHFKKIQSLKSKVRVTFTTPQRAATPGQFAVFYKKGECLGGGVIF